MSAVVCFAEITSPGIAALRFRSAQRTVFRYCRASAISQIVRPLNKSLTEIAQVHLSLFFAEFLEARIIPERIANIGSSRSSAGVSGMFVSHGPAYGIESSFCKAAIARSGSPMRAATRARISIGSGPVYCVFLDRIRGYGPFRQSQRSGLVTKAHIGQRKISDETIVFRLFFEERFQFAARLAPTFLSGGMVASDFLRPT